MTAQWCSKSKSSAHNSVVVAAVASIWSLFVGHVPRLERCKQPVKGPVLEVAKSMGVGYWAGVLVQKTERRQGYGRTNHRDPRRAEEPERQRQHRLGQSGEQAARTDQAQPLDRQPGPKLQPLLLQRRWSPNGGVAPHSVNRVGHDLSFPAGHQPSLPKVVTPLLLHTLHPHHLLKHAALGEAPGL